jgi:hypothetical protein
MIKRLLLVLALLVSSGQLVLAQAPTNNDYFGGMMPGGNAMGVGDGDGNPQANAQGSSAMPKVGDLTGDEKRMRRKYTSNVQHAKDLIKQGQDMEKKGKDSGDPKLIKKGKIYQEIGKKALGDLEANIPTPDPDLVREKKERDTNPSQL